MFVLTVEDGTVERGLKLVDGGLCDVVGDLLSVFGPEVVAEVRNVRLWHGRQAILLRPGLEAKSHLVVIFFLRRKDFVGQRTFCNHCKLRWK